MQKFSTHKRRAISTIFNLAVFGLLVACFAILLWQLPNKAAPAAQTETAGQVAPVPTAVVIETETVPVEEIPLEPSILMTETYVHVAAPELGVVTDEKQSIIRIEPGSAAEKAGLQLGDIVESIEGIPVALEEDQLKAKREMGSNGEGREMHLIVIRTGEKLEIPFIPLAPPFYPIETQSPEKEPTPTITPVWPPYHYY